MLLYYFHTVFSYLLNKDRFLKLKKRYRSSYHNYNIPLTSIPAFNQSAEEPSQLTEEQNSASLLTNQTTNSLSIITVGITLFTLFGGVLSVVNILLSQSLYKAVDNANEASKSQQELIGFRLLQEGREYAHNSQYRYAVDKFEETMKKYPDTIASLQAEYEAALIYADSLTKNHNTPKLFQENKLRIEQLLNSIRRAKLDTVDCKRLEGDTYYLLGCTCGDYFKESTKKIPSKSEENMKILDCSIDSFENARRHDKNNADFLINSVISYGLANNWTECEKALNNAKLIADDEPLYNYALTFCHLNEIFEDYYSCFTEELRDKLKLKIKEISFLNLHE